MRYKLYFSLFLMILIVFSFNLVVAEDMNGTLDNYESVNNEINEIKSSEFDTLNAIPIEDNGVEISSTESDELNAISNGNNLNQDLLADEDCKIIYVGTNGIDGGNGSYDNPFTTFKAASEATNGENNVIINVFSGTYCLGEGLQKDAGTPLKFNTNNLNIIGNGSVVIKNYFNDDGRYDENAEAFSLVSSSAKFTFSNLIFDASDCDVAVMDMDGRHPQHNFFLPFYGETELGIFNNCSFIGFATKANKIIYGLNYNSIFRNCNFLNCGAGGIFGLEESFMNSGGSGSYIVEGFTLFENCIMSIGDDTGSLVRITVKIPDWNISVNNVWFGQNEIPKWIHPMVFWDSSHLNYDFVIPVNRYAIFNVTQEYLGNDTYKIIGKLTWNGTEDQDGMENFQPMTVKLVSENGGELASEVKLINGTFETYYKNSASTHFITATLDSQPIELEFTTVNITAEGASIYYGEDQNITVNLSQVITKNVTIVVSNATYNKTYVYEVNGTDSFTFNIPKADWLKAGTYNITIILNEHNLYGIGTTTLTVSKVSDYKFYVVPSDVKFGGTETITVTLPDDAEGTVTVQFGNETQSSPAKSLMTFNFIDLKVMTYDVNVTYSGNDKYISKRIPATVTVNKADSGLEINDTVFAYGETINIPFTPINANGVTVSVLNEDDEEVNTTSSNTNMITLGTLPVGEYTLELTTVVDKDGNYDRITKFSKLTITKTTPSMNVIAETVENITVTDNITLTVKLPSDVTGNVIIRGNGKKLYNVSANETLTFKISPSAGDYVVDVLYSGDSNYESDMKTNEFIISKAETSITANPIAFEEGNSSTIEVNIPNVDSGIIFVDVADKKFYGDINAGRTTVLINGLPAGNYTAKISFAGNEKFKPTDRTVDVNVTAAPDIIGELNEIIKNQTNQIAALNNTVNAQNNTIKNQTDEIAALNNTVNAQNNTIKNQTDEIAALNNTVNTQNQIIETQKDQINNLITPKKDTTIVVDKTFTRAAVDASAGEKGEMFYAILKDANGNILVNKTVQISYNGEIYNKITDSQGRVGLQINLAKAGTYPITISFAGDDTYNASPLTLAKLTVTKKKTTIKASNKAFKAKKKSKKISITLQTVKNEYDKKTYLKSGKKIILKVKGKTYTAKINKKGVAKFTIKLTKKGKYTAKIKFAGDDTYKASSKTIKIRIK